VTSPIRFLAASAVAIVASGCANSTPSPPSTGTPSGSPIAIRGNERLGWDQGASGTDELATIGFALYLDRVRLVVDRRNVSCTATSATTFDCRTPLPSMTQGTHTLELAAFYLDTPDHESGRAGPLQVTVTAATASIPGDAVAPPASVRNDAAARAGSQKRAAAAAAPWPSGAVRVIESLDRPTDLAFTPDGRLWIADAAGRIRVATPSTGSTEMALAAEPAVTLPHDAEGTGSILALAADPQFSRNHYLYAIYVSRLWSRGHAFALARFREAHNTLADRIVLLDDVPASADAHASLRFGADHKLYAAFDDGGNARLAGDAASFNGKILRLNSDGTTPDDSPGKSPIFMGGGASPRGLAWHAASGRLWDADTARVGQVLWPQEPSGLAALHDDLFVASAGGLTRSHIDTKKPDRLATTETVVHDIAVRAVAIAPDGTVHFATADAIGKLPR
jgi:glucose/arabinose dehydrogenase